MKSYAIIMAGGVGARFWPYGTSKLPKQLLPIASSSDTMIQQTVKRLKDLIPHERIFIITNKQYVSEVRKQVPKIPNENVIGEPMGRNTAPCVGLAAVMIKQFDEKANMLVVPADHLIQNEDEFRTIASAGLSFVSKHDAIVTIGINPTHPETGYGYVQFIEDTYITEEVKGEEVNIYKVKTFAEKPTLETAKIFLESGDFLWNSGMFIFRSDTILKEIDKSLPDLSDSLKIIEKDLHTSKFNKTFEKVYSAVKSISIDYGVMEKSNKVYVIKGSFIWSDLGSWDEVYRLKNKKSNENIITGNVWTKDSNGNLIMSNKGFVGLIGVDDLIVINTKDGVLICKKGRSQEVKEIVDYLKRKGMSDLI